MEPPGLVGSVWRFSNIDSSRKCSSYHHACRLSSCWYVPESLGRPPNPARAKGIGALLPASLLNPEHPSAPESSTQVMSVTLRVDLDSLEPSSLHAVALDTIHYFCALFCFHWFAVPQLWQSQRISSHACRNLEDDSEDEVVEQGASCPVVHVLLSACAQSHSCCYFLDTVKAYILYYLHKNEWVGFREESNVPSFLCKCSVAWALCTHFTPQSSLFLLRQLC